MLTTNFQLKVVIIMAMPKTTTYPPYLFSKTADFGSSKSVTNEFTGVSESTFVKQFTLHVYPQKRTLDMQYRALGTDYQDARTLVIRHNKRVTNSLQVQYEGKTYKIISISPDDSSNYQTYDFLTIQSVEGESTTNG